MFTTILRDCDLRVSHRHIWNICAARTHKFVHHWFFIFRSWISICMQCVRFFSFVFVFVTSYSSLEHTTQYIIDEWIPFMWIVLDLSNNEGQCATSNANHLCHCRLHSIEFSLLHAMREILDKNHIMYGTDSTDEIK